MILCGVELTLALLPPALIKSTLAANPLPIAFSETDLKAFQEIALNDAGLPIK